MIIAALVLCALLMAGWMVFIWVGARRLQWHIWQICLAIGWLLAIPVFMGAVGVYLAR